MYGNLSTLASVRHSDLGEVYAYIHISSVFVLSGSVSVCRVSLHVSGVSLYMCVFL